MYSSLAVINSAALSGSLVLASGSYPPAPETPHSNSSPVDVFATTFPGHALGPFTTTVRYPQLREDMPVLEPEGGESALIALGLFAEVGACFYFASNGTLLSPLLAVSLTAFAATVFVGSRVLGKLVERYLDHIRSDQDPQSQEFQQVESRLAGLYPETERYLRIGPGVKESDRTHYKKWRQDISEAILQLKHIRQRDPMRILKWLPPGWAIRFFLYLDNSREAPIYKHELMTQVIEAHENRLAQIPLELSDFYSAFRGRVHSRLHFGDLIPDSQEKLEAEAELAEAELAGIEADDRKAIYDPDD